MQSVKLLSAYAVAAALLAACGSDKATGPDQSTVVTPASCTGISLGPRPAQLNLTQTTPAALSVLGNGPEADRYTAEIAVRGGIAYTTTWNVRKNNVFGNKVNIWDVSGNTPLLVDSLIVAGAFTTGDVAVSDDGTLLVVATEFSGGSIAIYSLADPRHPQFIKAFSNDQTNPGVHTAELGRVNGKLYAFLSVDPSGNAVPARLVIVDLSTPSAPKQAYVKITGSPYVHDTYQRDGLLFVALWNGGVDIWDIGGCGSGASPENPRVLGNVHTLGGEVHNIWWYHDTNGSKRFAFVGEEGPGSIGSSASGDIHVIDITDPTAPKEVAFYNVPGAGTHNFSVDETNGVLYAAYYNGGVRTLDVRGDLAACSASQQNVNAAANLTRCDLRLMGRELAIGLTGLKPYVWGVQYFNGNVYASDMLNGIWKLSAAK
ncbi:MAG: hypothetical protein JWM41_1201 [Gemmatimonadetes bacterium]|nr:hypothetical protein [Gemmatimonadota bacterium]